MRVLKLALFSFTFLFILVTGISLFIPSHIRISRAVNIKAKQEDVMSQINDPSQWKNWHPGLDSANLLYVKGELKGVILDSTGTGSPITIRVTKTTADEVTAEFRPRKLRPVTTGWKTLTYPARDSITVQWYMDFHLRWYPWEKFGSLLLEKSHGARMEQGLTRLRTYLQSRERR